MNDFLSIQIDEISGQPPIALFTLSTNIKGFQTRLSLGWDQKTPSITARDFLRLLQNQTKIDEDKPILILKKDGRVAYHDPKCPDCSSKDIKRNGTQKRQLKGFFDLVLNTRLQKYRCLKCGTNFKVNLDHIIPKYGHHTNDLRKQAIGYSGDRALSLGESVDLTNEVSGVRLSRNTIRLWKFKKGKSILNQMKTEQKAWSGIYSYDEQYVQIKGERWYRALLFDIGLERPVSDIIIPDRNNSTLLGFLQTNLEAKPVYTFVTDCAPQYPSLIKEAFPFASHQICVIHTMFNTKFDFNEAAGLSRYSNEQLPENLRKLYGKLWAVFLYSKNVEEAEDRFLAIYSKRFEYFPKVRHRLELIAESFVQLTEYLVYNDVPMTNNPAEGYFHRTYPDRIKKRFRTPDGFQAQISCIDARKGGIDEDGRDIHTTLRQIYVTFAQLIANL